MHNAWHTYEVTYSQNVSFYSSKLQHLVKTGCEEKGLSVVPSHSHHSADLWIMVMGRPRYGGGKGRVRKFVRRTFKMKMIYNDKKKSISTMETPHSNSEL